jgi:hypothetical protein
MHSGWDDDNRVTSELYRLMPPRQREPSQLADALDAARGGGIREALDVAAGTPPAPPEPVEPAARHGRAMRRQRLAAGLSRMFGRVDVWILVGTFALVVIALLRP